MSREMKDSEVEWIGEIPSNWEIISINNTTNGEGGILSDGDWIESKDISENGIRYLTTGNIGRGYFKEQGEGYISQETFKELNALAVYPGDLVASRLNLPIGRACILPEKYDQYVIAVDNVLIRTTDNFSKKYLMYSLNTDQFSENGELLARGTTMKRISGNQFKKMKVPMPSVEEQNKIASFLDVKTSEIDNIVEKTKQSIEELKAYKQSLITETVTKGLNPDAPMKDSGIEWIGEIPVEWSRTKMKNVSSIGSGTTPKSSNDLYYNGDIYWIQSGDLYQKKYIQDTNKKITEKALNDTSSLRLFNAPYLVVAMYGASIGNVSISNIDATVNQAVGVIEPSSIDTKYLYYVLTASRPGFLQYSVGGTQPNISQTIINNWIVPLPPLDEQEHISKYLENITQQVDILINKKQQMIKELESYKQSLIYEYVTGKKEVE